MKTANLIINPVKPHQKRKNDLFYIPITFSKNTVNH